MYLNMEGFIAILTIIVSIIGLVSWILILIALFRFFRHMQNVDVEVERNIATISDTSCHVQGKISHGQLIF